MKIGELWADEERPTIDGDYVRGILVLGRVSKNPVDTDGGTRGTSTVTRKFSKICESAALFNRFDGAKAHVGPHKYDGNYPDADQIGTFHGPKSTPKGVRMDLLCRKIGESYHPQALALRDNIQNARPFGGFSPMFEGECDMTSGEVYSVGSVMSIDWVANPSATKSIVESEAETADWQALRNEVAELRAKMAQIAESMAPKPSGPRTVPIPLPINPIVEKIDPFQFVRRKAVKS